MRVGVLGPLVVTDDAGVDRTPRGARQRALLLLLVLHRGSTLPADRLVELLWGDDPPTKPANALQAQISQLRKALEAPDAIVTVAPGYRFATEGHRIDHDEFEADLAEGGRALDAGDPARAALVLRRALDRWRGPALAEVADLDAFQAAAVALEERRVHAIERWLDAELQLGRHDEVVAELETLTVEHPWRERLWALRMLALYRAGRQADALRAYQDARARFADELGLEPGADLRDLETRILRQDPTLDAPHVTEGHPDALDPEPGASHAGRPTRVRRPRTRLVGRAAEIEDLLHLVETEALSTIIGPGGVGKTRLATEVASRVETAGARPAWFVELASVQDPDGVIPAVVDAIGVRQGPGGGGAAGVDALVDHLDTRPALLVLDNCEHVVDAVASAVNELVDRCPELHVLVTTREALAVPGERLVPLETLPTNEAVELFADRARAVHPRFDLAGCRPVIEELCRRLDGLPLAIELAAARIRSLTPDDLAARLDDRFAVLTGGARTALPRQQTLRAVVDWSYDLLPATEQAALARLGVFVGGCTPAAAEAVVADTPADSPTDSSADSLTDRTAAGLVGRAEVLDLVGRLVEKSLVVATSTATGATRYGFLQTMWDYARERLAEAPDTEEVAGRHARYFVDRARLPGPGLRHRGAHLLSDDSGADLDNFRAAHDWLLDHDPAAALQLATDLALVWWIRGDWDEAGRRLARSLDAIDPPAIDPPVIDPALRLRAQAWIGFLHAVESGPTEGFAQVEDTIDELRALGDVPTLVEVLLLRASGAMRFADVPTGVARLDEADELLTDQPDAWAGALGGMFRANLLVMAGDVDAANERLRQSFDVFEAIDDPWALAETTAGLALLADSRGDLDRAEEACRDYLALGERLGLAGYQAWALHHLAQLLVERGDLDAAEASFVEAAHRATSPWILAAVTLGRGRVARLRGDNDAAHTLLHEALSTYTTRRVAAGMAQCHTELAWATLDQAGGGDPAGAPDEARRHAELAVDAAGAGSDARVRARAHEALAAVLVSAGDTAGARRHLDQATAFRGAVAPGGPDRAAIARIEAQLGS